jgi:serine/threonine protein kinase
VESALTVQPIRFGRYVLLDRIGLGGMAEVFRAVMPGVEGFKRTFVVKRILAPHSQSPKFVEMFIREARIGAMLNHPNIVQVYDFGSVDGAHFLVMEYLRGRDILEIIRRLREMQRPFPIPLAAFVAQQVASCLAYAHTLAGPDGCSLNIIHRDVSPSNIMCLRTGGVKLLDFGIAKIATDIVPEHTEDGTFKGKLAYTAPERVRNEPFDARSDLYGLGVVLWEMLTCRHLFRANNVVETFQKILTMPVALPSSLRPDIPARLDAIVMRAIDRNPANRYASGQEMADELEEVVQETKFQSRMLPKLLVELFGSGQQSSQVGLQCLGPELLAAAGSAELILDTGSGQAKSGWKSWRLWAAVGATATLLALLVVLWHRVGGEAKLPPPTARPTAPPVAAPVPRPEEPTAQATPEKVVIAPAPMPKKSTAARRPAVARPRINNNPIADGLSIDPFAEAATRGKK